MEHSREKALEICQWKTKCSISIIWSVIPQDFASKQQHYTPTAMILLFLFCFNLLWFQSPKKKNTSIYIQPVSHTSLILVRSLLVVNRDRERERERDPKQKTKEISREILRDRESGSWFVGTEGQLFAKGSPKINFISYSLSSL